MAILKNTVKTKLVLILLSLMNLFEIAVSSPDNGGKKDALVFNRFRNLLVTLPDEPSEVMVTGPWATACLAPKSTKGTLMKNALIVKQIYRKGGKVSEVKRKICDEAYKLALMYDLRTFNFKFGYAIYYELNNDQYFHRFNLRNFLTPEEVTEFMRKYAIGATRGKFIKGEGHQRIKDVRKETSHINNDEIWFDGDERMEFAWITLFTLRFDFYKKIIIKIQYNIFQNNRWPVGERCEDYTMGSEVYEDIKIDELYNLENQAKIFENIKTPPVSTPNRYLSKWLLIPVDQFIFGSSASLVCSDMATIPIWTDRVEKVLIRVDQFLFVLHKVLDESLLIISGISDDILELPIKNSKIFKKKAAIYLDSVKKKIPVPRIVYKIVKYRPKNCIYVSNCVLSAIIIIHNNPLYDVASSDKLCSDITSQWGWADITTDPKGNKFNNIYVCENEEKILTKLLGPGLAVHQQPTGFLNLLNIPEYGEAEGEVTGTYGIRSAIYEKLKNLDANGMNSDVRNKGIMVRSQQFDQEDELVNTPDGTVEFNAELPKEI